MSDFLPALLAMVAAALALSWALSYRRAERRFEDALEAAPSGMMLVQKDGVISFANGEARRMFASPLVGQSVETLIAPDARKAHTQLRDRYQSAPEKRSMGQGRDLVAFCADGRSFPVEIGLNPIKRRGRRATLAAIVDITERKEAERALLRSNAELEQFAYLASHDIQEPLRMVASYTQLLGEKYKGQLDERADRYIGYATEGAVRIQTLVRDLLSYSRLSGAPSTEGIVDLSVVVADALIPFSDTLAQSKGQIIVGELPSVMGDRSQLERVFSNLIGNALKFRADAPPCVTISGERRGVTAVLTIADNGIGVDSQHFDRVFLMFQRLHERGKYEGSGIGLAIVKKIVEGHGGEVWFHPPQAEGTKISFTLTATTDGSNAASAMAIGRR